MANNKVELSTGEVLIDLTSDTVAASNLLAGETAHNRSGEPITGTVNLNNYVLKSGDTMSGNLIFSTADAIKYAGTKATYPMIRFIDNTSDTYGNGIYIGGGGQTIIGGGESAGVMAAEAGTSGSEYMWIGNDVNVEIYTNLQNGWASRKTFSFDTSGNLTVPGYLNGNIYDGNVYWGGSSKSGGYTPIDAGFLEIARGNRFAGIPGSAVTVEYTRNGGSSWGTYTNDNSIKTALFTTTQGFYIGAADSNNKATANGTNYQLRITINTGTGNVYSEINKFGIYVSTNGSQECKVQIRTALESTPTTFVERGTYSLSGWSGWNVINLGGNSFTTYGNTASAQYGRIQFIFSANGGNTNYIGLQVLSIYAYGGMGWVTPSTLAKTGHLYSYDSSLSASFPNAISAAGNITSSGHIEASTYVKANSQLDATGGIYLPRDTSGKDFNSLSPSINTYKIFEQYGGSNNPYGTQWAYVLSMHGSDSTFEEQFAINETNVSSSDTGPHVKYRRKYGGTWESWYEFLTTARAVTVGQGGTGATDAAGARANIQVPRLYVDSYPTIMAGYDGTSNNWIKFGTANTGYGILPSQSGNAGSGHNYLGTSTWYWRNTYTDNLNDYNMHPSTSTGTRNTTNTSAGTASYIKYGRVCVVSISVTPNSNSAGSGKTLFTGLPKASLSQYFVLQCAATSNYKHLICTIDGSGTIATSGDGHLNLEYRGQLVYIWTS